MTTSKRQAKKRHETPLNLLRKYWGYATFLPLQESIINAVLAGQDTLAILATGSGKSICYQVPGLCLGGLTVVISPLIALMKDQADDLNARGILAVCLHRNTRLSRACKSHHRHKRRKTAVPVYLPGKSHAGRFS